MSESNLLPALCDLRKTPTYLFSFQTRSFGQITGVCVVTTALSYLTYWQGPVFVYYSLTNYYQNHRRYVKSRDYNQLRGEDVNYWSLYGGDCTPYVGNSSISKPYAPCGAIANSMFNGMTIMLFIEHSQSSSVFTFGRVCVYVCLSDDNFRKL